MHRDQRPALVYSTLGISEGDEVLLASFTLIAFANAVHYEKATPVFLGIDPQTLNRDPSPLEQAITPQTRAIIIVHTLGCPAELTSLLQIARRPGLFR
jgi:perosamine synthetase